MCECVRMCVGLGLGSQGTLVSQTGGVEGCDYRR